MSSKVIVVMPAYNAEKTLERTVADIPKGTADTIILVDDCSRDQTVSLAKRLGLQVIQHQKNTGYGGNQKTCYREALAAGADVVVMIHPDYQYDARLVPYLTGIIKDGICDVVLGNRIRTRQEALGGGMPFYKYLSNRFLTVIENLAMGQNLGEWHSGLRAYSRKVLETLPWEKNSDDFVFDCEFLVQAAAMGFRLGDIPVPARYFKEASSINFSRSVRYGLESVKTIVRYHLHRLKLCPIASVRPPIKTAFFLACLATLAAVYFNNTPLPLFQTHLKEVGLALLILWSAGGWGARLLETCRLKNTTLTPLEDILFAETVGLGCLSLMMVGLGTFNAWVPLAGWALVLAGLLASQPFLRILQSFASSPITSPVALGPALALWTGGALSFAIAFAPITYYDSLVYHLALPTAYLQAHHWVPLPGLIYSAFPQTLEMLWTLALLVGDDIVVNLIGWSLGALLLAAIIAYGRRFLDRSVGWLAAGLMALMPAFLLLSSGGYVDVGLTLFTFMAVYAICLWNENPSTGGLIVSGLFAGWAAGTKYTGALPAFLIAVCVIVRLARTDRKNALRGLFTFCTSALVVFSPWLIKNTLFIGNPVFPFLHNLGLRTLNPWVNDAAAGYFLGITEYFSRSVWSLPEVLWEAAVNGVNFGRGIDVLGDFGWLPIISLLPALWLCRKASTTVRFLVIFSGCFFGCWALSRPVLRFLLPICPLWALLAAQGWVHGVRTTPPAVRWVSRGVLGTFLLSGLFLFFYTTTITSPFGVALGLEDRRLYLNRMLNYYGAATFVNTRIPTDSRVYILGDQRGYYYQQEVLISPVFSRNPLTEWANAAGSPRALQQKLKDEGVTHILVNRVEFERLRKSYPTLRFNPQGQRNWDGLQSKLLTPLYRDRACDVYAL